MDPTEEFKQIILNIQSLEELNLMDKRDAAIIGLLSFAKGLNLTAGLRTVTEDTERPLWAGNVVAYIELPQGEISYFMKRDTSKYSGYTRKDKLDRIADFIKSEEPIIELGYM